MTGGYEDVRVPGDPPADDLAGIGAPALDAAALLDHLGDAVVITDERALVVGANLAVERLFGWPRAELLGLPLSVLVPERLRRDHLAGFARFLRTREPRLIGRAVRVPALHRDGHEVDVELSLSTLRAADGREVFLGALRDISGQVQLEQELRLATYLRASAEVTARIAASSNIRDVRAAARHVLAGIGEGLSWQLGGWWELDETGEALLCTDVWLAPGVDAPEFVQASRSLRLGPGTGLPGRVWKAGSAVWIADINEDGNFPRAGAARRAGLRSAVAFPVSVAGRVVGVCEFFAFETRPPDAEMALALATIGRTIGQYVERRRIEHSARQRLEFLARAGELLDASLDLSRTLQNVASLAVPFLADLAVARIVSADGEPCVAARARDVRSEAALRELAERHGSWSDDWVAPGQPVLHERLDADALDGLATDPTHAAMLRELGIRSLIVVPLSGQGGLHGSLSLAVNTPRRDFGPDELALARDLARRAELALDNAQLFTERSYIARRLQQSLLPAQLPEIPGVEVAVRYLAAGEGIEVGGDFYDVAPTQQGGWLVMVGDVCGKGVDAAAVAGLARHSVRALALHSSTPATLLRDLNEALLRREEAASRFCTVVLGELVTDGGVSVRVCSAGHPLPVVLRRDGGAEMVGEPGDLLGVFAEVEVAERDVALAPGDALVLYTDGVVERRDGDRFFGEAGLLELLERHAGASADEIAGVIESTVADFQPEAPRDDLAVLVVRAR